MGKTIIISSHILLELADLCNKVGIIERGQMQFLGTVEEIMARARAGAIVHVGVRGSKQKAAELLQQLPIVTSVEPGKNGELRVTLDSPESDPALLAQKLVAGGFGVYRLEEDRVNLETAFMRLTKGLVQ